MPPAAAGPHRPPLPESRLDWVDRLKVLGMVFVVFAHTRGSHGFIVDYLYSFHMPLFFFLSGVLLSGRAIERSVPQTLRRHCLALVVPYVTFGLSTYLLWYLVLRHYGDHARLGLDPAWPLIGMLYGVVADNRLQHNAPLWFFTCLFVVQVYMHAVLRRFTLATAAAVVVVAAAAAHVLLEVSGLRLPWNADLAMIASVFFFAGHVARRAGPALGRLPPALLWGTGALALAVQVAVVQINGRVDLAVGMFNSIPLFYLGAFAGIWVWVLVATVLPDSRIASYFGRNTLIIFPTHLPMFMIITAIFVLGLGFPVDFKDALWTSFVYTALCFLFAVPMIEIIDRHLPWMIGRRRAGAGAPLRA